MQNTSSLQEFEHFTQLTCTDLATIRVYSAFPSHVLHSFIVQCACAA